MKSLPAWQVRELPEPLPYSPRNLFRVIGPGAILLATSIGGGEWLVGPAIAVQYGVGLLWIATAAIILQLLFNLEAIRYTLYTGEPIITGFMRLKPGAAFWAMAYGLLCVAQLGIPALAAGSATAAFSTVAGRMPVEADGGMLTVATYGVLLVTLALLLFGETVERTLEKISWVMVAYVFAFLIFVNLFFVPAANWLATLAGFVSLGRFPAGVDLALVGALAASAGSGGIGNLAISNWVRDKGFGMAAHAGAIASATSSHTVPLAATGSVFRIDAESLQRWKQWWKYVRADQAWLWAGGCLVGMYLNVNLATSVIPSGTDLSQIGAGAYQAEYMARNLWSGFWFLMLLNGFWVLFSTHLGNTEILVRTMTDIVWAASPRARAWAGKNARPVYYALFAGFTLWGMGAARSGTAMELMKLMGNIAGFISAVASIQLLVVNTRLLPKELQPPLWRRIALVACSVFYGSLFVAVLWSKLA